MAHLLLRWLRRAVDRIAPAPSRRPANHEGEPACVAQAWALIEAVDRGGIPLNPMRVNHIARALGLEVSSRAPVDETIERIRAALHRTG